MGSSTISAGFEEGRSSRGAPANVIEVAVMIASDGGDPLNSSGATPVTGPLKMVAMTEFYKEFDFESYVTSNCDLISVLDSSRPMLPHVKGVKGSELSVVITGPGVSSASGRSSGEPSSKPSVLDGSSDEEFADDDGLRAGEAPDAGEGFDVV